MHVTQDMHSVKTQITIIKFSNTATATTGKNNHTENIDSLKVLHTAAKNKRIQERTRYVCRSRDTTAVCRILLRKSLNMSEETLIQGGNLRDEYTFDIHVKTKYSEYFLTTICNFF